MVNLFGKKKAPEEAPQPETGYGEEPSIKEQVGYPTEGGYEELSGEAPSEPPIEAAQYEYEAPPESPIGAAPYEYEAPAEEPFEGAEAPPEGFPEFLPPAGAPEAALPAETFTQEDIEQIAREVADEVRKEFEEKLKDLSEELEELKKIDREVEKIQETFEKLGDKYSELEDKISELPTQTQEDLKEIKAVVNNINQIMSSALPALIKEVRDLKQPVK